MIKILLNDDEDNSPAYMNETKVELEIICPGKLAF